ncbi:hypothetical protein [Parabacteroides pacaensis]|uniref:hypothetical protein n=1 Tax=Parabacteroides pacaensis TaxID=2086575 RepID=UPI00131BAACE|nr:hypothetical protein [Parabacteroides pacaensis]
MKNVICGLSIFFLLCISFPISAYTGDKKDTYSLAAPYSKDPVFYQDRTVSNHSLTVGLLGLNYTYEYAFSPRGTIQFSAAAGYTYGETWGLEMKKDRLNFTTKDYHLFSGSIRVEPRFYYNLQKRHRKEKRTWSNSGGYLSTEFAYNFPIAITHGVKATSVYSIIPYWGFRRVWNHFLLDLAGGVGYLGTFNGQSAVAISLRLGIGYKF